MPGVRALVSSLLRVARGVRRAHSVTELLCEWTRAAMAPFYRTVCASFGWEVDASLVEKLEYVRLRRGGMVLLGNTRCACGACGAASMCIAYTTRKALCGLFRCRSASDRVPGG